MRRSYAFWKVFRHVGCGHGWVGGVACGRLEGGGVYASSSALALALRPLGAGGEVRTGIMGSWRFESMPRSWMSLLILLRISLTLPGVEGDRVDIADTKMVCRRSWSVVRSVGSMILFCSDFNAA
jgi:hypothetical protein